tara:strand:+ start:877 stop:1599 length:723 start_codon:yes stop_codon:yes gene_type:complete
MSEPELRSIEMLLSVSSNTPAVEIIMLTNESIKVRVRGESQRWYQIVSEFQGMNTSIAHPSQPEWSLSVTAGRWQNDVISENQFSVELCLHSKNHRLPIGDRIVSLVLALYNDLKTALKIPMLAQFIVCQREMLKGIVIFQDTMIVTQNMIDEDDFPYHQMDEDEEDEEEEMDMYGAFEREDFEVSSDQMSDLQQAWEEEIDGLIEAQVEEVEIDTEKKEKEEQELIDFWEIMADKLHEK